MGIKGVWIAALLGVSLWGFGQGMPDWDQITDPALRVDSLTRWAYQNRRNNPKNAFQAATDALALARAIAYPVGEGKALLALGHLTKDRDLSEQAIPLVKTSMVIARANALPELLVSAAADLGTLMSETGKSDSAVYYFLLAEKVCEQNGFDYRRLFIYELLASHYQQEKDYDRAEKYFLNAFAISSEKKIRKDYGYALYLITNFYKDRKNLEAFSRFGEMYSSFRAERENPFTSTDISHFSLINARTTADRQGAIRLLLEMIPVHQRLGNYRILNDAYVDVARLKADMGAWDESAKWYEKAIENIRRLGSPAVERQLLRLACEAYMRSNKPDKALEYLDAYLAMSDSLEVAQTRKNREELEVRYETEKNQQQIAIQELQLAKERQTRIFLLGGLGLAVLAALGIGYALVEKNRINQELARKNTIIAENLAQRELLLREIHHRVKNNLQMVSSMLRLQSRFIQDPNSVKDLLEGSERIKSIAVLHEHLYRHGDLAHINMKGYLHGLIDQIAGTYVPPGKTINLTTDIDDLSLDIDLSIPLGLIVNELATNAYKHTFAATEAGELYIGLKKTDREIRLTVADNGPGVLPGKLDGQFGFDLARTLAHKLQGVFEFSEGPGAKALVIMPI